MPPRRPARARLTGSGAGRELKAFAGLSAEEAFDILVRASQRENRKLRTIATELVERAQQPIHPSSEPA